MGLSARDLAARAVAQDGGDRDRPGKLLDAFQRHSDRHPPAPVDKPGIAVHPVGSNRDPGAARKPDMAIDARALVPPAFQRIGIDAHGYHVVLLAKAGEGGDIDVDGVVGGTVARNEAAVDPDLTGRGDAAELQFQPLAPVGFRQPERAAIPADPARTIALRHVGFAHEGLRGGPIVGHTHHRPVTVVPSHGCGAARIASLYGEICLVMAGRGRHDDIAFVKAPAFVQKQPRRIVLRQGPGRIVAGGKAMKER